jgi:hypothetical protein
VSSEHGTSWGISVGEETGEFYNTTHPLLATNGEGRTRRLLTYVQLCHQVHRVLSEQCRFQKVSWCFYRKERQANSDYRNVKNAKDLPESSFATFAKALIHVFAVFAVRPLRKTQDELSETALVREALETLEGIGGAGTSPGMMVGGSSPRAVTMPEKFSVDWQGPGS